MPPLPEAPVGEHGVRSIVARRAGHATTWMRTRTAQVKPFEGHPIVGRTDHRARAEQLVEAHLAVEDVAADEAEAPLKVQRRMDLPPDHRLRKTRSMGIDSGDDLVGSLLALIVPASARPKVVTKMLAEEAVNVPALGPQRRIQRRRDQHLDDRLLGPPVPRRIEIGA